MDRLGTSYDYVIMDNEAGMEHISRRTTRDVDHLLLVTDTSQRGVIAARRIVEMVPGLEVNIKNMYLIVNRVMGEQLAPPLEAAVRDVGVQLLGLIPNDPVMSEYEFAGRPLVELPSDTKVVQAVYRIADKIFANGQG
jgi:CO dehydrogenase maturation factor